MVHQIALPPRLIQLLLLGIFRDNVPSFLVRSGDLKLESHPGPGCVFLGQPSLDTYVYASTPAHHCTAQF